MSRSITFESRTFGVDPMILLEREQNRQVNEQRRAEKRPILTVRKDWSEARKAAERLFTLPRPIRESQQPAEVQCLSLPEVTGENSK